MKTKQQFEELTNAIESKTRDNGEQFYCYKDGLSSEIVKGLRDIVDTIYDDSHDFDLTYNIINSAISALSDVEYKDLDQYDPSENNAEYASPYTGVILGYLNAWNESDITDILKEYSLDSIAQACAIWYDQRVQQAIDLLVDFINED